MEDTHEALRSGAVKEIHLQDDEIMLRHAFHIINGRVEAAEVTSTGSAT
jgi:hypothetical protein